MVEWMETRGSDLRAARMNGCLERCMARALLRWVSPTLLVSLASLPAVAQPPPLPVIHNCGHSDALWRDSFFKILYSELNLGVVFIA